MQRGEHITEDLEPDDFDDRDEPEIPDPPNEQLRDMDDEEDPGVSSLPGAAQEEA